AKKMGRPPLHSLRSFHYERPIFPLAAETAFTETTLHYLELYSRFSALFPFASPTPLGIINPNRVKIDFPISIAV
ncbi:MAG: hypothetical protein ABGX16_14130, partial [Pirellulales bacterium]